MCYTRESFICMWAKTWRNPTTASHSRLWARLCWFPVHGPWVNTPIMWAATFQETSRLVERQVNFQTNVLYIFKQRAKRQMLLYLRAHMIIQETHYDYNVLYYAMETDLPVCTQSVCWRPVWPLGWPWRSCVGHVHQSHPSLSSTSRSHWLTPTAWHRNIFLAHELNSFKDKILWQIKD